EPPEQFARFLGQRIVSLLEPTPAPGRDEHSIFKPVFLWLRPLRDRLTDRLDRLRPQLGPPRDAGFFSAVGHPAPVQVESAERQAPAVSVAEGGIDAQEDHRFELCTRSGKHHPNFGRRKHAWPLLGPLDSQCLFRRTIEALAKSHWRA